VESALARFGKQERFSSLASLTIPSLIIAGYLALAGSGLWAFSRPAQPPRSKPIEASSPALICRCGADRNLGGTLRYLPAYRPAVQKL
jgi:hypothetical protein